MKKRTSFIKYIQLWSIIIIVTIGVSHVAIDIIDSNRDFTIRADQRRREHIDSQKQMIKREVERVVDMILAEKARSENRTKLKIKSRIYEAYSIAQHIYQENVAVKNEREIQKMIIDGLSPIRFENNCGYYFISRFDGVAMLFPSNPDLEGKDLSDVQDANGKYLTKDMIKIVEQSGEGFYQYHWAKPGVEGDDHKKIAFVKKLNLYGWFIGTGLYADDVDDEIKADLLLAISRIRFGKEGYIFVNRLNGDALIANGKLLDGNKKLWEVFDEHPDKIKKLFEKEYEAAYLKPGGDFIYYSFVKLTDPTKESPKASFIYGIPDLKWAVGAGVYLDDVEEDIALMQIELNNQIKKKMLISFLVTLGVVVFFLILFDRFNRKLKKDFNLFISFFNQAAFSDEPINREMIQFDELDRMAKNANSMISDRREAEEALRNSEENLRAVFAAAKNVAFVKIDCTSKDPKIVEFSPGAQHIFGYTPKEILGQRPEIFYLKGDRDKCHMMLEKMIIDTKSYSGESIFVRKSGETFPALFNIYPVFIEAGKTTAAICVYIDITQQKRAEEELRKAENLKSVGTLAGGIAHDFNNIMMGLFGNISIAKEELPKDHPGFKYLEEAEVSMNRAIRLTKQLLIFSKGGEPVTENINLDRLVEEVVNFDLSGSSVKPVFEKEEGLWSANVDKGQIEQVFSNLVINSKQAMPHGGHLYINFINAEFSENEMLGLDPGKYIRITVRDEGTGICQENLNRIFDPYFTTKHAGSGLGLTTVYSIILAHGGNIHVESQLGEGTTFTLYLPVSGSNLLPEAEQSGTKIRSIDQTTRILLMDDEDMICDVVSEMLEKSGFSVETASDGKQAIESYKQSMETGKPFDVVIMDLTIPGGLGGKDAVREILKIDPDARVIVSSGYANDPVMANHMEYGFCGIVAKPYTKKGLLDVMSRCLNK